MGSLDVMTRGVVARLKRRPSIRCPVVGEMPPTILERMRGGTNREAVFSTSLSGKFLRNLSVGLFLMKPVVKGWTTKANL